MPIALRHFDRPRASAPAVGIGPNAAAAARLREKRLVPTGLDSREIAGLPLAAREAGFFSAKVATLRTLSELKAGLEDALAMPPDKAFKDRAAFIADSRIAMGAPAGDSGRVTDIASEGRLGLIYDFQMEDAYSKARWEAGQDADILDEYPAQEFLRVESRQHERADWQARWTAAGGKLSRTGRMIARKDSPVWMALSKFGRPWPPFDYGSGMGVADVSRAEAVAEGVITKDDVVRPDRGKYQKAVEMSAKGIDPEMKNILRDEFADSLYIDDASGKIYFYGTGRDELVRDRDAEHKAAIRAPLPRLPDGADVNAAIASGDARPVKNPQLGEIPTVFEEHLNERGPYSREYRKAFLPAAREALAGGNHFPSADAGSGKYGRPEVFYKIYTKDGEEHGVMVLVEKAADWKTRLETDAAMLRSQQTHIQQAIGSGKNDSPDKVARRGKNLDTVSAKLAALEKEIAGIDAAKPYGRAWNYYDSPADKLREDWLRWTHRNDTPPKRNGGKG